MSINTVVLVPLTEHGVPSGNYDGSSLGFVAPPQKAANYYQGRSGLQTIRFAVSNFIGAIAIQATLDADPVAARWFTTYEYGDDSAMGDGSTTETFAITIQGNFVWLRASVTNFQYGTIDLVTASY